MKSPRAFIRFVSILCTLSLFAVQPGFAATKSVTKLKSAGRTANSIPNTILNGIKAPIKSIGINGDFYIDTKNLNIYGPKKNNSWPAAISLRGIAGSDGKSGTPGVAGSDGKTITNTSTSAGTAGATGATGLTGAAGSNGAAGETGAAGASGSAGPAGPTGPAGSTGATGATGAAGASGLSGVTSVSVGTFSFINTLSGTAGSGAQSENFGGMVAGKKYLMHLVISGVNSGYEDLTATLVLEIFSTVGIIPITTVYFVSSGKKNTPTGNSFTQNIFAEIVVDGTLVTETFNLFAKVTNSKALATTVTLSGYYSLTEVGSIT
uniref:hypothetical protein n=1 Tax=Candidatus Planktophila sp. TaxID=2175601 RepID=UPI00404A5A2C